VRSNAYVQAVEDELERVGLLRDPVRAPAPQGAVAGRRQGEAGRCSPADSSRNC